MAQITTEHVDAKKIIKLLEKEGVKFTTSSDSSEARNQMPTPWSAGTDGLGVKTTIKVHSKDDALFDKICKSALNLRVEREVPEGKSLRERWPFRLFIKSNNHQSS